MDLHVYICLWLFLVHHQLIPDLNHVPGSLLGHRVTAGAQCFYNSLVGIGGQIPFRLVGR